MRMLSSKSNMDVVALVSSSSSLQKVFRRSSTWSISDGVACVSVAWNWLMWLYLGFVTDILQRFHRSRGKRSFFIFWLLCNLFTEKQILYIFICVHGFVRTVADQTESFSLLSDGRQPDTNVYPECTVVLVGTGKLLLILPVCCCHGDHSLRKTHTCTTDTHGFLWIWYDSVCESMLFVHVFHVLRKFSIILNYSVRFSRS